MSLELSDQFKLQTNHFPLFIVTIPNLHTLELQSLEYQLTV